MCETTLTFGQRGSHFFQSPSQHDYTRLPQNLASLLTSRHIKHVHHVALGFEDSFLLIWRDVQGHDHIDSQGLLPELTTFLYAKTPSGHPTRHIPSLRLTLGPYNDSFFASDSHSALWLNLPPPLLSALQSRIKDGAWTDRPRLVALGADANFVLITEGHAAVWELGRYAMLSRMLTYSKTQERGIADVRNVALHAYRYECFVAQSVNGTLVCENIPPHESSGVEKIRAAILKDTRAAETRAQGKGKSVPRRPSGLRHQASSRREWGERKQEFRAESKGLRLSLSLSINPAAVAGRFGKMLLG